jgi:hypothetical protein
MSHYPGGTPKKSLNLQSRLISLGCKLISKLTVTRHCELERLDIITLKHPSASLNPVTQLGFNFISVEGDGDK